MEPGQASLLTECIVYFIVSPRAANKYKQKGLLNLFPAIVRKKKCNQKSRSTLHFIAHADDQPIQCALSLAKILISWVRQDTMAYHCSWIGWQRNHKKSVVMLQLLNLFWMWVLPIVLTLYPLCSLQDENWAHMIYPKVARLRVRIFDPVASATTKDRMIGSCRVCWWLAILCFPLRAKNTGNSLFFMSS